MEGRRIPGDGLRHEQEYIRERIEQAGDTDEYAEAAGVLEQELQDLRSGGGQESQAGDPSDSALRQTANMPVEGGELRQGPALDVPARSGVDPDLLPPQDEARARVKSQLEGGTGGTGLDR
jgi:hypothetical protein